MFCIWRKKTLFCWLAIIITFFCIFSFIWESLSLYAKDSILLSYHEDSLEHSNKITTEIENAVRNIYHKKEKIAYLTFDDGPTSKVTPKVLDILDELEIKANFL